ncbi:hypothetical protein MPDQ_003551 [Monascus purpureus]|uniref:F-box domain-containing protein n=1 Tax=Monascus purpureus TaxID=5098 RepID=A0A507QKS8_MONPU|nr:hypothetical protein MPDQ_003551 [Monascus purpureus]BDD58409.1 hypothetical protein MAP00_003689 [Monascus purpureus]
MTKKYSFSARSRRSSTGTSVTAATTATTVTATEDPNLTPQDSRSIHRSGSFRSFLSHALRPKRSRKVLRKSTKLEDEPPSPPPLAPLQAHREKYRQLAGKIDPQLGENLDYTTVIHALGLNEHPENQFGDDGEFDENRPPGEPDIASLSPELWAEVAEYLNPAEVASLAFASKTLHDRLGDGPWRALDLPENREYKIKFLVGLDRFLPGHLLCFPCVKYHVRTKVGRERLKPAHVVNPLFECPNARNTLLRPPRHRIAPGRTLPFAFVQLVLRAWRYNIAYGITPDSLNRRWQRGSWTHSTRFVIDKGHLLMRVSSSAFADPGMPPSMKRLLLFNRDDYWPYFSVCDHWRDGELMNICKCALDHIPVPRDTAGLQGAEHKVKDALKGRIYDPNAVASLCGKCRPMRRCPECPTEYLVEVRLTEDKSCHDPKGVHFRQAIVVTRWSDLGDGKSPLQPEWASINGQYSGYDSFAVLGKRSISGIFESAVTYDTIPGQRIISLNPKNKKADVNGDSWY